MQLLSRRVSVRALTVIPVLLALVSCGQEPQFNPGMLQVSTITVEPQRAAVLAELPGRVDAVRDAQIRARVTGIVQKITFQQGADVKENQPLFKIDPAAYKAAFDQAAAQLKQTQADLFSAKQLADRYTSLVKVNAVGKQEYDDAIAAYRQADAAVAAAKANLQNASINLGYTNVTSLIAGRIGRALITEGALVDASSATQMAAVQQLDPVYIDFTQTTTDLAALRRAFASGQLQQIGQNAAKAVVVLEDGSEHSHSSKLLFTEITVDPTTGQVNLRAEVPNPEHTLLPGMFVQVRLDQGINEQALPVPQQALQRTADGLQSLMVVRTNKEGPPTVDALIDNQWMITSGLKTGDAVVVEGFQKIRLGTSVKATAWTKGGAANASPPAAASTDGAQAVADKNPETMRGVQRRVTFS